MLYRFGCTLSALFASIIALSPALATPQPARGVGVRVILRHKQNYLILRDPHAEKPTYYYARRAHFTYSAEGHFVTREGMLLQGYAPSEGLRRQGPIGDIQGPPLAEIEAPQPTTHATVVGNLPARYDCHTFDPAYPEGAADASVAYTNMAVYDERGSSHKITFYFSPCASATAGPNHYDLSYDVNAMAGRQWLGRAHLFFDAQGRLAQVNDDNTAAIVLESGLGSKQVIALDLGDAVNLSGNTGRRGLTCYGAVGPQTSARGDGHAAGLLAGVETIDDFTLAGHTTTSATRYLGTLVTATFSPATRLDNIAPNIYQRRDRGGDDLTQVLQAKYRGKPSANLTIAGNLPFGFEETTLDPLHPENSSTTWATTQVFAQDASAWEVAIYFAREIRSAHARGYPIRYQYTATIAPADGRQPPQLVGNGTLYFDRGGHLAQVNADGEAQLDLAHIQDWNTPVALQFDHITVYDAPAYLRLQADGVASGLLTALRIHANGEVDGTFTNFLAQPVGALDAPEATSEAEPAQQTASDATEPSCEASPTQQTAGDATQQATTDGEIAAASEAGAASDVSGAEL